MKKYKCLMKGLMLLWAAVALAACENIGTPSSSGRPYEVLVVVDDEMWERPAGRALFSVLDTDIPGLPQPERSFQISQSDPRHYSRAMKLFRNIIQVEIDPNEYTQTKIKYSRDVFAQPQVILTIQSPDEDDFAAFVKTHTQSIVDFLTRVEMNRQITGRIATYDFAPTPLSRENLLKENVDDAKITVTGNTVIDALYWVVNKIKSDSSLDHELEASLADAGYDVARLAGGKKLVLITGHRRENFGDGFISMCRAIKHLTEKYPDVDFVYPMHLNPNVRRPIHEVFGDDLGNLGNMFFIEPLEYLSFVYLMEKSTIVLTDSGGIQEEAPGLGKPVLVMRDTTERPEALTAGTVKLVGTDFDKIVNEVSCLIDDPAAYERMSRAVNPYGDGLACSRIVATLQP